MLNRKSSGFGLIEALVALMLMSVAVTIIYSSLEISANKQLGQSSVDKIRELLSASQRYNEQYSAWPTSTNELLSANLISQSLLKSPYGTDFIFVSTSPFSPVEVSFTAPDEKIAFDLERSNLPRISRSGLNLTMILSPLAVDDNQSGFYHLDGSVALRSNFKMGGNDVDNVGFIRSTDLYSDDLNTNDLTISNQLSAPVIQLSTMRRIPNDTYVLDLNGTSVLNTYSLTGDIVSSNLSVYGDLTASRISDSDNVSYYMDFNQAVLNDVNAVSANLASVNANILSIQDATVDTRFTASNPVTTNTFNVSQTGTVNANISTPSVNINTQALVRSAVDSAGLGFLDGGDLRIHSANANTVDMTGFSTLTGTTTTNVFNITGTLTNTRLNATTYNGTSAAFNGAFTTNQFTSATLTNSGATLFNGAVTVSGGTQLNGGASFSKNLNIVGQLTAGSITSTNFKGGVITANRFDPSSGTAQNIASSGATLNTLNVGTLRIATLATAGQTCTANSIALNAAGNLLTCKATKWVEVTGVGGETRYVTELGNAVHGGLASNGVEFRTGTFQYTPTTSSVTFTEPMTKDPTFCIAQLHGEAGLVAGTVRSQKARCVATRTGVTLVGSSVNWVSYIVYAQ